MKFIPYIFLSIVLCLHFCIDFNNYGKEDDAPINLIIHGISILALIAIAEMTF